MKVDSAALGGVDPANYVGKKVKTEFGEATITSYNSVDGTYTIEYRPDANLRVQGYTNQPPQPQPLRMMSMFRSADTFAAAAATPPQFDTVTITVGEPPNQQTFTFQVPITQARLHTETGAIETGTRPSTMVVAGDRLYVLNQGDGSFGSATVSVVDTNTNTAIDTDPNTDGVNSIQVDGDHMIASGGRLYVVNSNSSTISVVEIDADDPADNYKLVDMDPSTADQVDPIYLAERPNFLGQNVAVDDAGTRLYVINSNRTISVINIDKGDTNPVGGVYGDVLEDEQISLSGVSIPTGMTVVGNKMYVADYTTPSAPGLVHVYDLNRGTVATPNPLYGTEVGTPIQVGVAPIGVYRPPAGAVGSDLYVPNAVSGTVSIIDTDTNQVASTVPVAAFPTEIAFSPDGSLAYVAGLETLSIIDTSSREFVLTTVTDNTPDGQPFDHVVATEDSIYLSDQFAAAPSQTSPNFGNTITVVSFVATDDANAPQITEVDVQEGSINPNSGAVPITLEASDADNDAISVIVTKPASGQVKVTPTGAGTYTVTYTPDPQARLDAYSSGDPVEETIVITVTDGQLTESRSVTVPVTPAQAAVTETRRPISGFVQVRGVSVGRTGICNSW